LVFTVEKARKRKKLSTIDYYIAQPQGGEREEGGG